jgi:tagatose 6-phosphate kinase
MPTMILCLGTTPTVQRSMIFDRLEIDGVNRAVEVREYASGKSPNVARVLRTLGCDPLVAGFAGGDRGKFLLADLNAAGIRCDFVNTAAPTRLCTTVINRSDGTATELVEESEPLADAEWEQLNRKLGALLAQSNVWVFSGSLPPGAPQDFYARWLAKAGAQKAIAILDARGEPLRLALRHPGFIVKLNREELAATLNEPLDGEQSVQEAARRIAPAGGSSIVTLGGRGALASDGKNVWRLTPPKVKAVSAVGSGDAFAAGLTFELSRGRTLPESLPLAAACGAANALTSLAGNLSLHDVQSLLPSVNVEIV